MDTPNPNVQIPFRHQKSHGRTFSSDERRRASLPRPSSRDPLDSADPLAASTALPTRDGTFEGGESARSCAGSSVEESGRASAEISSSLQPTKDLSFLLRPEIYRPLSHLETPAPFRALDLQPQPDTPLPELLRAGHLHAAAILSAQLLITLPRTTPSSSILSLFYTRLATLTLLNLTPFAAQESKALEDLSSAFYRDPTTGQHIVPWELRVLAVRLQALGWGDWRRGMEGYYELGRECRAEMAKARPGDEEGKTMWSERLKDLGVRVGSALIEMGDVEGAARFLESSPRTRSEAKGAEDQFLRSRMALLYLKMGNVRSAKQCLEGMHDQDRAGVLDALCSMAEGDYDSAADEWQRLHDTSPQSGKEMITHNLAVCRLYTGKLAGARASLEELVDSGYSFSGLTFNLSTIYELCSDKSRLLKMELAERVASQSGSGSTGWERSNADFKL